MKKCINTSLFLFWICMCLRGNEAVDIEENKKHHDDMLYKKDHETSWIHFFDDSRPKPQHDIEYGFKRGHGHENIRGDMEVNYEDCATVCTSDFKPVCGSDGVTYDNKCRLDTASCKSRQYIYVAYQGKC
ncbi:C3 and PZP-like alpha-2-macroglobulin domain-containing protein 8 [Mactra antiquata]